MTLPLSSEFLALQRAVAGRYSLDREIGRGGMGIVYLARDVALERPVAIKLLPPALAGIEGFRERFLREARTAAALSHPHIVPIHAVEESAGLVFFVMEYIAGETLGARVRRGGPLGADEGTRILREVAWALAHAHGRGIIHRDVKPDNILLEAGTGRVIVTDLGIAHAEGTAVSGAAGTPHYVAPELLAGAAPSVQSDLYALGVTAWVLFTGRRPFEGAEGPALLAQQAHAPAPGIGPVVPRLSPRLAAAIDRTLAREPAERWPSAEAFAGELGAALALRGTIPAPLLRFVREGRSLGEQVAFGLVGAVAAEVGLVAIFGWDDFAGVIFHTIAALLGSFALVRLGEIVAGARELRAQGWRQAAAVAADRVERDAEEPSLPFRAAPLKSSAFVLVSGLLKTALAAAVLVWAQDGLLLGLLSAAALVILPALTAVQLWRLSSKKKRSLWSRLLEGRLGRWLFDWAGVGLTEDKAAPVPGEPTALVLGQSIEAMYAALAPAQQKQLAEVPDLAARLQARALVAGPERTPAVVALETLRLDLLRVQAGTITEPELTADLEAVRKVGAAVDRVLEAGVEVRRIVES
jgi:hypothetical protein